MTTTLSPKPNWQKYLKSQAILYFTAMTNPFFKVKISHSPSMTANEVRVFEELLAKTDTYMEYGSGGSTSLALRHAQTVISVDNDNRYVRALSEHFSFVNKYTCKTISVNHATLGISGSWGRPAFPRRNLTLFNRVSDYIEAPWRDLEKHAPDVKPDLVLIDGRCRVAATLHSLNKLSDDDKTIFFMHDYHKASRPHYQVIAPFIEIIVEVDSAIVFKKKPTDNDKNLQFRRSNCRMQHSADWR